MNALLFDKITDIEQYEERNSEDSIFKENTNHFKNTKPIIRKTITLNELLKNNNTIFDLIKIDFMFINKNNNLNNQIQKMINNLGN